MNLAIALLFCIVAAVSASGYYASDYGFDKPENFARERKVNYVNGERQAGVNYYAEAVGASSGTYRRDGVPGTGVGNKGHGFAAYPGYGYNGAYPGYGYSGAYPGYGHAGGY